MHARRLMNDTAFWYLVSGLVFGSMAVLSKRIEPLPVSNSIIYLAVGFLLGPWVLGKMSMDLQQDSPLLETMAEIAVLISVFTAGLKLRIRQPQGRWWQAIVLTTVVMALTILGIAVAGTQLYGIPFLVAALLGAILAPTDPVLASAVQVRSEKDKDWLRFNLTAEAALNDGAAFPFVVLTLTLLTVPAMDFSWSIWFFRDVLWAILGSVVVGVIFGLVSAKVASFLRKDGENNIVEDLFCLGILFSAYACALYAHTYGFVACFLAGLYFRHVDTNIHLTNGETNIKTAPYLLHFSEQLERILEFLTVIIVGILMAEVHFRKEHFYLAFIVIFLIRPLAFFMLRALGLVKKDWASVALISWLGVRGVGSIYYLTYAFNNGLPSQWHDVFASVLVVVASSIVLHGVTSGPIMQSRVNLNFHH